MICTCALFTIIQSVSTANRRVRHGGDGPSGSKGWLIFRNILRLSARYPLNPLPLHNLHHPADLSHRQIRELVNRRLQCLLKLPCVRRFVGRKYVQHMFKKGSLVASLHWFRLRLVSNRGLLPPRCRQCADSFSGLRNERLSSATV